MFAQQIFQDSKENVKSSIPVKSSISRSRKGLKPCSLNNFDDSENVLQKKNMFSEVGSCGSKLFLQEKENTKLKVKAEVKEEKVVEENSWPDIEEMHPYIEPDDDYEDILPECERIQKADIDSLFFTYSSPIYTELMADNLPSPLKEYPDLDIPDFCSPLLEVKAALFDDSVLHYVPLPDDLFEG